MNHMHTVHIAVHYIITLQYRASIFTFVTLCRFTNVAGSDGSQVSYNPCYSFTGTFNGGLACEKVAVSSYQKKKFIQTPHAKAQ